MNGSITPPEFESINYPLLGCIASKIRTIQQKGIKMGPFLWEDSLAILLLITKFRFGLADLEMSNGKNDPILN